MRQQEYCYDFDKTKEDITNSFIDLLSSNSDLLSYDFYISRNIHSRFSIFIIGLPSNKKESIANMIQQKPFFQWIESIESIDKEDDFIIEELEKSSNRVAEKYNIYFSERHLDKSNWFINHKFDSSIPIISFYSFKGGLGRTTAMVLSAITMARVGKKVVLLDLDLEAPGLSSIFENENHDYTKVKGVLDFLIELSANSNNIKRLKIDDYYFTVNSQELVGTNGGELIIVPAAATDEDSAEGYIDKLSKTNITFNEHKTFLLDNLMRVIQNELKPDYILLDTRTGINDIGGMVFNRYSNMIFLFFYGNQQNMFGLKAMLPNLVKTKAPFFLINSPVPENESDKAEELDYFIESSYSLFSELYYKEDKVPEQNDKSAEHYPINVPFSRTALNLNSYSKLNSLSTDYGDDNPYKQIADIIMSNEKKERGNPNIKEDSALLRALSKITPEVASSDEEYKTDSDLKRFFYPRKDYKYIYDNNKFLILGDKGSGKTALFAVLNHHEYSTALAKYCGVEKADVDNVSWHIALNKEEGYPTLRNFNNMSELTQIQLSDYWLVLLFRYFPTKYVTNNKLIEKIKNAKLSNLKKIAQEPSIGEELEEELFNCEKQLEENNESLIFVYDYLDSLLTTESNFRGKAVSALLTVWYDYISRFKRIRSKIFLRKDIFDREVETGTDKVKLKNYSVTIEWTYDQLLNIIWKRLLEIDISLEDRLFGEYRTHIDRNSSALGYIPGLPESANREMMDKFLGRYMGGNNKAFPYNWIIYHVSDTNQKIQPRTILTLFSQTAHIQLEDFEETNTLIKPYNMETALSIVSELKVREMCEEYPEFKSFFHNLYKKIDKFPVEAEIFKEKLEELNELRMSPEDTIDRLKDIGVVQDYKSKKKGAYRRYHIPDIYLFGMKLKRRGPGAHNAIFKSYG